MNETLPSAAPKRPLGIVLVLCWYAYCALYAVVKCFNMQVVLFATAVTGTWAVLYYVLQFAVPAAIFWGIFKRRPCSVNLALVWQSLTLVVAVANYVWFLGHREETLTVFMALAEPNQPVPITPNLVHAAVGFSSAFTVIISALVIFYLARRRAYFRP